MSETTINQRLNFLLQSLEMKAGPFSRALGLSETTIRNYLDRSSKPSSDVLEKISNTFSHVNLVWLVTGKGEPFLTDAHASVTQTGKINQAGTGNKQVNKGNIIGTNHGKAMQQNNASPAQEAQVNAALESANKEIALLREQLAMKDQLIAAKEEMLSMLRNQSNRPN